MRVLYRYKLYWAPTGQCIAENVLAPNERAAIRLASYPYRAAYLGEIYAVKQPDRLRD